MALKLVFFLYFATFLYAQEKQSDTNSTSTIDSIHTISSKSVQSISTHLDSSLSDVLTDNNKSILQTEIDLLDFLHTNEKYLDDTSDSFVRLRFNSLFQSLGESEFKADLRAYFALEKTKQKLNLFIESVQDNTLINQFQDSYIQDDGRTRIGLNYFLPSYYSIESKYSIGLRGLEPYVQARYKTEYILQEWIIEPNQLFRYRMYDDIFEEQSYLYLDTKIDLQRFFRIYLFRGTRSDQAGMDYGASLIYNYLPFEKSMIALSQSFIGNTKYTYLQDSKLIEYNKINSYKTQFSWRQNIWKKWFYYEIIPAVSFNRENNFRANYQISFLTDFYFGSLDF